MTPADVIVVGSGPSGAQAAKKASDLGLSVMLVDVGNDDPQTREGIPPMPFSTLRRTDPKQQRYFVGDFDAQSLAGVRVGAQLTPPRQYIARDVERLAPLASENFHPLQSLALGGLGAGWGAGSFTFSDDELGRAGLPVAEMLPCYDEVARDIGISGEPDDDAGAEVLRCHPVQPALPLDTNAAALLATYVRRRRGAQRSGLKLGRTPLAMLSRAQGEGDLLRAPNPLEDMDFYSDRTRSVYRPRYTIEELKRRDSFRYVDQTLALRFAESADGVELFCRDLRTGADVVLTARRLILAAGALATTRLALASLGAYDVRVPLLANPYLYMPCVNLAMLGRPAADRRHSLSQLVGLVSPPSQPDDTLVLSLYSYRALLLHKLVKEMPLPVGAGLLAARLLLSSLTVVGVNFPERPTAEKWMLLRRRADGTGELAASYSLSDDEQAFNREGARLVARALRTIGCIPFASIDPGNGSSIHYGGGLTMTPDRSNRLGTSVNGRLHGAQRVYVADSANWSFLPAKGPTLTMMANARRVAAHAADDLRASAT